METNVRNETTGPNDVESKRQRCTIDHVKAGFDAQAVYAWRGPYKGKLGTIVQMSGSLARVSFGSAMQGDGVLYIPRDCLIACVPLSCPVYFS